MNIDFPIFNPSKRYSFPFLKEELLAFFEKQLFSKFDDLPIIDVKTFFSTDPLICSTTLFINFKVWVVKSESENNVILQRKPFTHGLEVPHRVFYEADSEILEHTLLTWVERLADELTQIRSEYLQKNIDPRTIKKLVSIGYGTPGMMTISKRSINP